MSRVRVEWVFDPFFLFADAQRKAFPTETGGFGGGIRIRRTAWEEQAEAHHVLTFLEQLEEIGANPLPSQMLKTLVGSKTPQA